MTTAYYAAHKWFSPQPPHEFDFRCDECSKPATTVHCLPWITKCEQVLLACPDHDPGGYWLDLKQLWIEYSEDWFIKDRRTWLNGHRALDLLYKRFNEMRFAELAKGPDPDTIYEPWIRPTPAPELDYRCDECGNHAKTMHFLPSVEACERIAFACPAHSPDGPSADLDDWWDNHDKWFAYIRQHNGFDALIHLYRRVSALRDAEGYNP